MKKKMDDTLSSPLSSKPAGMITLCDEFGIVIGELEPINTKHLQEESLINQLTAWRNDNMKKFLSHFVATTVRTRDWLEKVIMNSDQQVLWLVYAEDKKLVGHFGFKDLSPESVLLDNAIRGERSGHPKLFVIAGKAVVNWLFVNTSVTEIRTIVLANNVGAVMMNREIGFHHVQRYPLLMSTDGQKECQYIVGERDCVSPVDKYCYKMYIYR